MALPPGRYTFQSRAPGGNYAGVQGQSVVLVQAGRESIFTVNQRGGGYTIQTSGQWVGVDGNNNVVLGAEQKIWYIGPPDLPYYIRDPMNGCRWQSPGQTSQPITIQPPLDPPQPIQQWNFQERT
ncbi:unnamed protein product [Rhizoctonia solani]|uniref:Uncharacterized protein n=1 Tax=Rhizoctonia solani TaxID=456999 RepID=A0A8H2WR68_9AGAM|nr:unnamed protein product [Rhizoctonia solani]